jgi:uncharacterized protein DUF4012
LSSARPRRVGRKFVAASLVLVYVAVMIGLAYGPYAIKAITARSDARALTDDVRSLGLADLNHATLAQLRARLEGIRADVGSLRAFLANDPLMVVAQKLDATRDSMTHAETVLLAADELAGAGDQLLQLGDRFVSVREAPRSGETSLIPELVELVGTSTDEIDTATARLSHARALLATVPDNALGLIASSADLMRASVDRYAPLLEQFRTVAHVLPSAVGWRGSARYLVLAQDPAELRPTGGYTGTVGNVGFTNGALTERSFRDVYELDLKPGVPFVEPPQALANHLIGDSSWQLADANWSPDFPTAARQALDLYTLESGDQNIDGVIGLTTYAVDRLLAVTGPVEVPEYGVTVSRGQVTLTALRLTRGISTPDSDRKAFLDYLASNLLDRLFALPSDRWPALIDALIEMADQRLIQTWFKDPEIQAVAEEAPIGAAVRQEPGDYVYVVEANVAPTSKYNLVVKRSDTLEIQIDPAGDAHTHLRMDWQNDSQMDGEPYASIRSFSTSTAGFYGSYVRVLTPVNSELVSATGAATDPVDDVEEVTTEAGRTAYGTFLLIGPGTANLTYDWTLAGAATRADDGTWTYVLTMQKQPGLKVLSASVKVVLPAGARIVSSSGATAAEGQLTFTGELSEDLRVEVSYSLP